MKTFEITAIKRVSVALEAENSYEAEQQFRSLEQDEEIGFHTGPVIIESIIEVKNE